MTKCFAAFTASELAAGRLAPKRKSFIVASVQADAARQARPAASSLAGQNASFLLSHYLI
jgi:hypothetical protein